jgi:hypothetical protein
MSNIDCKDRERILRQQDPAQLEALRQHAGSCAECAEELRWWDEISAAAPHLHRNWESPYLWPRIAAALAVESERKRAWTLPRLWNALRPHWQPAVAAFVLLLVTASGGWLLLHRPAATVTPEVQRRLLTEQAVRDAEKSEEAYSAAIEKLVKLAEPKVENPTTPLMASYREKLLLLDDAIAECRAQAKQNPGNPQLQQELLSMYQEKERTLQEVAQEE